MLIIVEGMDNTGKTTLIQRVSEDLKLLVMNNRKKPVNSDEMEKYLATVSSLALEYPVILDRLCTISEPVYGQLRKTGPVIDKDTLFTHMKQMSLARPMIIYCRPPTGVVLNFGDRPQMDGVIEKAPQLLEAYDHSMNRLAQMGFKVVHWDYTNYNYNWILNQVINHLESK